MHDLYVTLYNNIIIYIHTSQAVLSYTEEKSEQIPQGQQSGKFNTGIQMYNTCTPNKITPYSYYLI